jgi:hypothetical protein
MTTSTVAQYLAALPADRRAALSAVRILAFSFSDFQHFRRAHGQLPCGEGKAEKEVRVKSIGEWSVWDTRHRR